MSAALRFDISDSATPLLARAARSVEDSAAMHRQIAREVLSLVRDHFTGVAEERHDTALSLGAKPSQFWGRPDTYTTAASDGDSVTVSIRHPGIGRALHDVEIVPRSGLWLTIPIRGEAYNQRAYRMQGLFFVQPEGKSHALLGRRGAGGVQWLYLLVHEVHQSQDRTLLPPDEAFQVTALTAAREYIASEKEAA